MPNTRGWHPSAAAKARRDYEEALARWKAECEEQDDDFEVLGEMAWGWAIVLSCTFIILGVAVVVTVGLFYWLFGVTGFIVLVVAGALVFELANFLRKKL